MKFEWTPERYQEFDDLIEFMEQKNLNNLIELYRTSYLVKEQEEFYYSKDDAWEDIQSIIKGEL